MNRIYMWNILTLIAVYGMNNDFYCVEKCKKLFVHVVWLSFRRTLRYESSIGIYSLLIYNFSSNVIVGIFIKDIYESNSQSKYKNAFPPFQKFKFNLIYLLL